MKNGTETSNGSLETLNSSHSRDPDVMTPRREETRVSNSSIVHEEEEDDWEALADREVPDEELLPLQKKEVSSSPSQVDSSPQGTLKTQGTPKRRGRGSFMYKKSCLYSDQPDVGATSANTSGSEDEVDNRVEEVADQIRDLRFGTGHILVLYDFSPSTRTIDLEKLFDDFRDHGFAIRWVNDTTALAVFRTPSIAHEAHTSVHCPFKVRILEEEDNLLTKISSKDLETPLSRPKTSARTAQRLIAQGMGIKLPSNFGSNELRKQEEARKNRIHSRQILKDDAWGSDNP